MLEGCVWGEGVFFIFNVKSNQTTLFSEYGKILRYQCQFDIITNERNAILSHTSKKGFSSGFTPWRTAIEKFHMQCMRYPGLRVYLRFLKILYVKAIAREKLANAKYTIIF